MMTKCSGGSWIGTWDRKNYINGKIGEIGIKFVAQLMILLVSIGFLVWTNVSVEC